LEGNLLSMRFLLFIFFLSSLDISAQPEGKSFIGATFQYNSLDFFLNVNYSRQIKKVEYSAGLGFGINRTIFQQRLFPHAAISGSYYFLDKEKFQLGPTLLFQSCILKVNSQKAHYYYYNQFFAGYTVVFGKRLKVYQSTFYGVYLESYYSTFLNKFNTFSRMNFAAQIGLKYEI
jgi:hypothetical protein